MKTILFLLICFTLVSAKEQSQCPVSEGGMKLNKSLFVDKDGKRIYYCCEGCRGPIEKNFDEYVKKIEAKGETVALAGKAQETCPVMGGAINKELYVDKDGKRMYMCCAGCTDKMKADFDEYAKKYADEGITLDTAE